MAVNVIMPALEMAQDTGTLVAWRKKEGEAVAKGEPLLEIETDKAVVEIESPGDGVLVAVKFHEGAVVPVGKTIAWIVRPGEQPPKEEDKAIPSSASPAAPAHKSVDALNGRVDAGNARVDAGAAGVANPPPALSPRSGEGASRGPARMSPKARNLAREHGVDVSQLQASGPDGEILASDILAFVASRAAQPSASPALSNVARLMAERTTQSWTTVPHFSLVRELDATALNRSREELNQAAKTKLSHTDLLVALVARVLRKHPRMNASWAGGRIEQRAEVNIGIAIAVQDGVVAPVIRKADAASLNDIAAQRMDLAERARAGKLAPGDLTGGTFTISNLGMFGVDAFNAIIVAPQAGILAVGRIADRVVAIDGKSAIRPMMVVTLSCDHRVIDGAGAAQFLQDLAGAVANPATWLK
jgi:pyruvate dehydrogenase E2 component (dihydrolipoamide acetyltransferase)